MKGLRSKKKVHTRHSHGQQKQSPTFAVAKDHVSDPSLHPEQVAKAVSADRPKPTWSRGNPRSPSKKFVKRSRAALRGHVKILNEDMATLKKAFAKRGKRLEKITFEKKALYKQIRKEKKASEAYLDTIMEEANTVREEAQQL